MLFCVEYLFLNLSNDDVLVVDLGLEVGNLVDVLLHPDLVGVFPDEDELDVHFGLELVFRLKERWFVILMEVYFLERVQPG